MSEPDFTTEELLNPSTIVRDALCGHTGFRRRSVEA